MKPTRTGCSWCRDEHCSAAQLNLYGRCVADCWRNWVNLFLCDCTGIAYADEQRKIAQQFGNENKTRLPR